MTRSRSPLGIDIGGANLKAADCRGATRLQPFELWKHPEDLADALRGLLRHWPPYDFLAITMTGELCDCFASKREGVHTILDAVALVAGSCRIGVWQTPGGFLDIPAARARPLAVAAANWHALATFCGRLAPRGPALLLDVGSTTTDVVSLVDGIPLPRGRTDPARLECRELVYTGAQRTPLCALLGGEGTAELFATTLDVYLVLGLLPEDPSSCRTADGRPATRLAAHGRLARMLGADTEISTEDQRLRLAHKLADRQARLIRQAVDTVARGLPARPEVVILSGSGEFLARRVLALEPRCRNTVISLAETLGTPVSAAACAYALAVLASEQSHD
jgi:probable H4MPT-linked C1 transfer pathway protein